VSTPGPTRRSQAAQLLEKLAPEGIVGAVLVVLAAVLTVVGGTLGQDDQRWLIVAGASAAIGIAVPSWVAWAERRRRLAAEIFADDLQADFQIATARVLAPIAETLAEIQHAPQGYDRRGATAKVQLSILYAALDMAARTGCADVRVVLFRLGAASRAKDRTLIRLDCRGRQSSARNGFDRGDRMLAEILVQIDEQKTVRVANVDEFHADYYRDRSYKTFIASPICAGKKPLGLLCIDAPEADSLPPHLEGLVRVLASMLALVMS
jgi:hypothetical protein